MKNKVKKEAKKITFSKVPVSEVESHFYRKV